MEWRACLPDVFGDLYMVSECGDIKRRDIVYFRGKDKKSRILKGGLLKKEINETGYERVVLRRGHGNSNESFYKKYLVHCLVADAFVDNPVDSYNQVNHIDGNKRNNHYTNLEWVDNATNVHHSYHGDNMIHSNAIAIVQYDANMQEVNRFKTIREAERQTGLNRKNISRGLKNGTMEYGYYWKKWERCKNVK